jgi:lipopolysaccharide/colanic/teichoic acid biosynthesis glycosyltransferase
VFFRQKRKGLNGQEFEMLKFRSMRAGEAPKDKDGKEMQATQTDPRVTPIGRILRKTSLDETPQILNVLKGDMSIVGPRPHALSHDDYYGKLIESYTGRHKMRPGITGWAQLHGFRGETETVDKMAARVEYDIWYIEHWNIALDIKILLMTPFVVFFQKTAY